MIGLIGLSSINTDPRQQMRGYSDQEVWRLCIRDIQDTIIHTMSDIIKVNYYLKTLQRGFVTIVLFYPRDMNYVFYDVVGHGLKASKQFI